MVNIGGTDYTIKPLTVRQAREAMNDDQAEYEINALALSTGADRAAVAEWYDSVPAGVVLAAVREMWTVTNATEEARFPGGSANDAGDERDGV